MRFLFSLNLVIILMFSLAGLAFAGEFDVEATATAAEKGDAHAQYVYGYILSEGEGVKADKVAGAAWYKKSAEQNYAPGQRSFGLALRDGEGVSINLDESVLWLRKAADQNDEYAMYHLALAYYYGDGVPKDRKIAANWLKKSADLGLEDAKDMLEGMN